MGRSLPSATKLTRCVTSPYRGHMHFRAVFSCVVIGGPNHHTDYLLLFFLYHFLNTKRSCQWQAAQDTSTRRSREEQLPVTGPTARTPWEVICRTREKQLLHLMAFHTIRVQTETTAQNTSQRRVRLGISLYLVCACCRQLPWLALVNLQHLIQFLLLLVN